MEPSCAPTTQRISRLRCLDSIHPAKKVNPVGRLDSLKVFGNDYPTSEGTGVRDYIHVVDLALGHLAALETHRGDSGVHVYNLGTGRGISVLEMLRAFEKACGQSLAALQAMYLETCISQPRTQSLLHLRPCRRGSVFCRIQMGSLCSSGSILRSGPPGSRIGAAAPQSVGSYTITLWSHSAPRTGDVSEHLTRIPFLENCTCRPRS